jgi:hypothetical protein
VKWLSERSLEALPFPFTSIATSTVLARSGEEEFDNSTNLPLPLKP